MSSPDEVKQLLEKKATFVRGVRCLASTLQQDGITSCWPLVTRVHAILKARYSDTSIEAWKAGQQLFSTCMLKAEELAPEQASKVKAYLADAQRVLAADEEVEPPQPAQVLEHLPGNLHPVDILLGLGPHSQPPASHFDDAGPIVDEDSVRWARAQRSGSPTGETEPATTNTFQQQQQQQQGQQEGTAPGAASAGGNQGQQQSTGTANARRELQQQILEGLQVVLQGVTAVTRGTEAVERELEQVLSMMRDRAQDAGARPTPPMSKKVFNSLPVVELDAAKLSQLGEDPRCAVCTDSLAVGDKVLQLPCKGRHWYHPACVKPWLSKTNSCPVCREELPTDDHQYEADKEHRAEAEAERAGAANALSHNEFMYI